MRGWSWWDKTPGTRGKETMKTDQIPDHIKEVGDEISKQILVCILCQRNYKVIPQELRFYHQMSIPIPRQCPECRHQARNVIAGRRKLYHRQCKCDLRGHGHHADGARCANEFETTYAPERTERVFCELCYQKEVV